MIINEKLLFACQLGRIGDRLAGVIMDGTCLPIACSHASWAGKDGTLPYIESGIASAWEATGDIERLFGDDVLGLMPGIQVIGGTDAKPNGLYVYEVEYDESAIDEDSEVWEHLQGGTIRRPTTDELEPLTRGQAPWDGVVL